MIREINTAYSRTPLKGTIMKNLKKRFDEDPAFALTVIVVSATLATALLKATAKAVEASAYAYRASKM